MTLIPAPLQALMRTPKHIKGQTRAFIAPAYNLAKSVMPKISDTERAALESGTISFDRDIFSGDPKVKDMVKQFSVKLSEEEQAFMDNEVEQLCEMIKTHDIVADQNLNPATWEFIRKNKFMGLVSSPPSPPILPLPVLLSHCNFALMLRCLWSNRLSRQGEKTNEARLSYFADELFPNHRALEAPTIPCSHEATSYPSSARTKLPLPFPFFLTPPRALFFFTCSGR